jgi:hypothetical protein
MLEYVLQWPPFLKRSNSIPLDSSNVLVNLCVNATILPEQFNCDDDKRYNFPLNFKGFYAT